MRSTIDRYVFSGLPICFTISRALFKKKQNNENLVLMCDCCWMVTLNVKVEYPFVTDDRLGPAVYNFIELAGQLLVLLKCIVNNGKGFGPGSLSQKFRIWLLDDFVLILPGIEITLGHVSMMQTWKTITRNLHDLQFLGWL